MNAFVAQAETVGDLQLSIREHRGDESVPAVPLGEFVRGVRADRQDFDAARVELGPEFFPSPQLGDTVGSPVSAKELDEHGMSRKIS